MITGPDSSVDDPLCTQSVIELSTDCDGFIQWECTSTPPATSIDQVTFSAPQAQTTQVFLPTQVSGEYRFVATCR